MRLTLSFGEVEFWFACSKSYHIQRRKTHCLVKVITLMGLIIFGLVIDLGGGPNKEFIGGRYWRDEPFNDRFMGLTPVSKARFLGFWAVFTKAAFSYGRVLPASRYAATDMPPEELRALQLWPEKRITHERA